jgi:hypothetical protein
MSRLLDLLHAGAGTGATTTACLLFAIIDPTTTYWAYAFVACSISVMGADLVYTAGALFIAKFALPHEQSVAGALFNTMTQVRRFTSTTLVQDENMLKAGYRRWHHCNNGGF